MKKLLMAGLILSCTAAFAGGYRIGLNGTPYKNEIKDIQVQEKVEIGGKKYNRFIAGLFPLTDQWQRFEFSFIPASDKVTLDLSGTHRNEWIAFDDFKITGGELYNPSFEIVNDDKEADGWCYYARECLQTGDASDGKNYMIAARDAYYVRKDLTGMVPGQRVTVSFAARKVKEIPVLSGPWKSSAKRKVK